MGFASYEKGYHYFTFDPYIMNVQFLMGVEKI